MGQELDFLGWGSLAGADGSRGSAMRLRRQALKNKLASIFAATGAKCCCQTEKVKVQ